MLAEVSCSWNSLEFQAFPPTGLGKESGPRAHKVVIAPIWGLGCCEPPSFMTTVFNQESCQCAEIIDVGLEPPAPPPQSLTPVVPLFLPFKLVPVMRCFWGLRKVDRNQEQLLKRADSLAFLAVFDSVFCSAFLI